MMRFSFVAIAATSFTSMCADVPTVRLDRSLLEPYQQVLCLTDAAYVGTISDISEPDPTQFGDVDVSGWSTVTMRVERNIHNVPEQTWQLLWPARTYPNGGWSHHVGWSVPRIGERYLVLPQQPDDQAWWSVPEFVAPMQAAAELPPASEWSAARTFICQRYNGPTALPIFE